MGKVAEKGQGREPEQFVMRPQQQQRTDRIRPLPGKGRPLLARQRLRQHKEAVAGIQQTEGRGAPERQPRIDRAEPSSQRRAENKPETEDHTDLAERRSPLLGRRHIGNIGAGRAEARRSHAGDHPPRKKPGEIRRQRHENIVEA